MSNILKFFYIITLVIFFSCDSNNTRITPQVIDKKHIEELLIERNIDILARESELIDEYIKQNNLEVVKTGTGLRYQLLNIGEGEYIKKGDLVTLQYEIRFLDNDVVYSSDSDGYKTFLVGRGGVESGLEEAILKLKMQSEAIIILPSHLAYGFVGDGNKIPYKSVLVYRIKVIDIK